jgi:hypothetical protein
MYLAAILDCDGEDYPEAFLDDQGDIRCDVAVRLGETAARVVDGELSLWELSEVFEEWLGLTITFMDGYGLNDLMDLWFEGGASSELGQEEEWPGPKLKAFFDALVDEMARYVAWQKGGRVGDFGSQSTGTAVAKVTIWEDPEKTDADYGNSPLSIIEIPQAFARGGVMPKTIRSGWASPPS